jgi:hypothetical protein
MKMAPRLSVCWRPLIGRRRYPRVVTVDGVTRRPVIDWFGRC